MIKIYQIEGLQAALNVAGGGVPGQIKDTWLWDNTGSSGWGSTPANRIEMPPLDGLPVGDWARQAIIFEAQGQGGQSLRLSNLIQGGMIVLRRVSNNALAVGDLVQRSEVTTPQIIGTLSFLLINKSGVWTSMVQDEVIEVTFVPGTRKAHWFADNPAEDEFPDTQGWHVGDMFRSVTDGRFFYCRQASPSPFWQQVLPFREVAYQATVGTSVDIGGGQWQTNLTAGGLTDASQAFGFATMKVFVNGVLEFAGQGSWADEETLQIVTPYQVDGSDEVLILLPEADGWPA